MTQTTPPARIAGARQPRPPGTGRPDGPQGPGAESTLHRGRFRLRTWIRTRLWVQVLIGLAAGLAVGALMAPELALVPRRIAGIAGAWLALPGKLFLGLIAMVLIPLVFASIVQGLTGSPSGRQLRSVGIRFGAFVLATTTLAALGGVAITTALAPGSYVTGFAPMVPQEPPAMIPSGTGRTAPDLIAGLLPTNPARAFLEQDMLAVVILAVLVGLACVVGNRRRTDAFLRFLDGILDVSMTVVKWAMFLAPWAVFGLTAQLVAQVGFSTLVGLSVYVGTVALGLAGLFLVYLALVAAVGRTSPLAFLRSIGGVLLLAFSTSSSAAVMPVSIATAISRLRVPPSIANIVVPLGATVNMAGTALYQSAAVVFLAQLSGIDLGATQVATIVFTLVVSSIGAPGTPGVSIAILTSVVAGFGIPAAGIALILGVDRILDMARTTVNVTGDLAACVLLRSVATTGGLIGAPPGQPLPAEAA